MDLSAVCFGVFIAFLLLTIPFQARFKRDAVGALDIVTYNAQPIHADVKVENMASENGVTTTSTTEKLPAQNGTTADDGPVPVVTPPKDVTIIEEQYKAKSLRKSWPLTSRLDMIRSVSRIVTLSIMIISAVLEYIPLVQHLYYINTN